MSKSILIQFLFVLTTLLVKNESAKILAYFPIPSISHQVVFRPLTLELAKRGHEVVVITTDPVFERGKTPANFTEIDVRDVSYEIWRKEFMSGSVTKGDQNDLMNQAIVLCNVMTTLFEAQMATSQVRSIIKDETKKFDLIIVETAAFVALGITHLYDAPVIQISSFGNFKHSLETSGMPMHPLVHPTSISQRVYNPTKWEKIVELVKFAVLEKISRDSEEAADLMLQRVISPDIPPLRELAKNVDMLFVNVHPIWEMNRPSPPNVIYMGGLHQKEAKDLPQDLKSYLDASKNGVIYISFGTNVEPSLLPSEKINKFVKVFSKLPYDVLWKWNQDELPGRSKNIKISKWLPQSDLLRHPKVKMFITQGGLQSTDEAIAAGVPLIGVPLVADQWYNVDMYQIHKIGLRLDMDTITEENIENAINTILKDESTYRKNVGKLHSIMQDQPQTPLERAVWWTEYVLRHGGAKHLRARAANMSWARYLELELLAYVTTAIAIASFIVVYTLICLWKFVTGTNVKVKRS